MYDDIQYADGSKETKSRKEIEEETEERDDIVSAPRSIIPGLLGGQKRKERMPNDSGVDMGVDSAGRESGGEYRLERKKGGLMGKFGL